MRVATIALAVFITVLLLIEATVVLYACFFWPHQEPSVPLFIVGVIAFVVISTLPFALITGYLIWATYCGCSSSLDANHALRPISWWQKCKLCCRKKEPVVMPTTKEGIHDASSATADRVDLLPRQFVRSHFGTLLDTSNDGEPAQRAGASSLKRSLRSHHPTNPNVEEDERQECHFHRLLWPPNEQTQSEIFLLLIGDDGEQQQQKNS